MEKGLRVTAENTIMRTE